MNFLGQIGSKYKIEAVLIGLAILISAVSVFIFFQGENTDAEEDIAFHTKDESIQEIYVDVSGAVKKPGVYKLQLGDRLEHAVLKSGGLSEQADRDFFARNFNLARRLKDQEKYYIPSTIEIGSGIEGYNQTIEEQVAQTSGININTADLETLDSLPGIGQITAQKITDNRPYNSVDELLSRKIIGKSTFEKIKDQLVISNQ